MGSYRGLVWGLAVLIVSWVALEAQATAYTITATAGPGGTVSPSGSVSVDEEADITFTFTPDPGYKVKNIVTAGVSEGAATSFTYYLVRSDYTLNVSFIEEADNVPETIYVDGSLTVDCPNGEYSVANRDNSGSDGDAYTSITEACDVAGPGDTILIRGGLYGTAGNEATDVIWPKHSGTPESPITIRPYGSESVVIRSADGAWPNDLSFSISRGAISMRNVHYITIEDLTIRHVGGWLFARDCNHITVRKCTFEEGMYGAKAAFRMTECDYWTIEGNTFLNSAYDSIVLVESDYNIIENNTFTTAEHSLLSLRSASYNIIRNNTFNNYHSEKLTEVFDQKLDTRDSANPSYIPVPGYNGTQRNLFEGNFFGFTTEVDYVGSGSRCSAMQFSGQNTIIRNNTYSNPVDVNNPDTSGFSSGGTSGGVAIVMRWGGSWEGWREDLQRIVGEAHEAGYVTGNRIYHNTFYGYDGSKVLLPTDTSMGSTPNPPPMKNVENYLDYPYTEPYAFEDNTFKNNIFSEGRIHAYINWTSLTQNEGKGVQMFLSGRVDATSFAGNNFFSSGDYPNELIYNQVNYPYQAAKTPAFYNANHGITWSGNVQHDPLYVDADAPNFHLQSTSSLIDAASHLTTVVSPAGNGSQITVEDAGYFYDGFGIDGEQGDLIRLGNGQIARIIDVDYAGAVVTVDRQVTWDTGEPINLYFEGTAPDIGAYEYAVRAINDLAVSGTSQNSLTLGWTVPGEAGVTGEPASYDMRYAQVPVTQANWEAAMQVAGEPVPGGFGDGQSFTITGLNPGATYYVGIKVLDEVGHASELSNVVPATTASSGNHAPVLNVGDRSVAETGTLTFLVSATDADGDPLTYSATGLPAGANFTAATQTFTWTPTNLQSGRYRVMFQVTDTHVTVSETITITVREASNQAPVLGAIGDKSVNENAPLSFSVSATDQDGDSLTFSATGRPSGATFVGGAFTWTPSYSQAGSYQVTFTVSDGELTDSEQITITVANVTDQTAPVADEVFPPPDAVQVPVNPVITFALTDLGLGIDPNTVALRVSDQLVYTGNSILYNSPDGICRRTGNPMNYRYYFFPNDPFDFDQPVPVLVTASDLAHNAMTPLSYQFVTEMRSFGQNQLVSSNSGSSGHPAIATDSGGNLWAAWHTGQAGSGDIYVAKRDSETQQWAAPLRLTNLGSDQRNPALAIGSNDTLYVTWQDNRRGNWDIYVAVSLDGITWNDPVRLTDPNTNETNPAIAIDRASPNHVYIAWQQDEGTGNQDIYVASSSTRFISKAVTQVTSHAASQTEPALAVGSDNTVYLVWTDRRNGSADIYGSSSGAVSWANVAIATGAGNQSAPTIAVEPDSSSLHVLWVSDTTGNLDIVGGVSNGLPAAPISGSVIVDDTTGADQSAPAVLAVKDHWNRGHIYACWQDNRSIADSGDSDLYFAEIRSGAAGTNILVGDDGANSNQSDPALGFDRYGEPVVLWVDDRGNSAQIYGACSTYVDPVSLVSGTIPSSTGGRVGPDPASIGDGSDVSIGIPSHALGCDALLAISEMQNAQKFGAPCLAGCEISPSGIQFSPPATVVIPYVASGSGPAVPYWYDAQTGMLSQLGITNITRATLPNGLSVVSFNTTHLTSFYVLEGSSVVGGGGGGGGGCALSRAREGSIVGYILPYGALALLLFVRRWMDGRRKGDSERAGSSPAS